MTALADLWPLVLVAGCGFLVFAVTRLARRFSPGALSAGPKRPPDAMHLGQSDLADDLRRIDRRLDTRPESLIRRVEHSCHELGVATHGIAVGDAEAHLEILLQRLEAHLELGSLVASTPIHDPTAAPRTLAP